MPTTKTVAFEKPFCNGKLIGYSDGSTFVQIELTPLQLELKKTLGDLKLSFLFCWLVHPCREQPFKRLHETCLTCPLRRVWNGDLPYVFEVSVHQIWSVKGKHRFWNKLFKQLCSLTELVGWIK